MASRFKPLIIAFWCLFGAIIALLSASIERDVHSEAVDKLHNWPTTRTTVTRCQVDGEHIHATVSFGRPGQIHGEGLLNGDAEHPHDPGEILPICYDPSVDYSPAPISGFVYTPAEILADTDPKYLKYALAWLAGAVVLVIATGFALYRGRAVLLGLFKNPTKPKATQLLRPIERLAPAAKMQSQLQQFPMHLGGARPGEVYFLAAPPPEIGNVISAESSVARGSGPAPLATRMAIGLILAGLVLVGMMLLPLIS